MPKESALQTRIKHELESMGAYVVNVHGGQFQSAGVPDLVVCYEGRYIGLEIKVGKNKASPLQLRHIARIQKAGGVAQVVYSVEEARDAVLHLQGL